MRKAVLVMMALVVLSGTASAETYRISGSASYSDNTPASFHDITVTCQRADADCYQYQGSETMSNAQGKFTLVIDANEDDDGTEILLTLKGEQFSHIIDLETHRMSSDGRMLQNLQLQQEPASPGIFGGFGCCLILFGLVFISTLLKTVAGLATPKGRAKFSGYREPNYHECPECNESVVQHLLVRHLIIEHDYDPFDAGEATGLVLRKSWDTDEQ